MTLPTYPADAQPPLPTTPPPTFAAVTRDVTVGRLVSRSISVWWSNLFKFGALTLLVFVPAMGLVGVVAYMSIASSRGMGGFSAASPRVPGLIVATMFPIMLVMAAVQMGSLTYGAVQHLAGRPVRFGAMLAAGFRRLLPLVGAGLVSYLMVVAGFLLLVVPGLVVGCAVAVAIPAAVVERIGPIDAIRRSWGLTRDHRLTILGAGFVLGLVTVGANFTMQLGVMLFGRLGLVAVPVAAVIYLLVIALPMLLPAVAYHELRAAKEGVATEELVKVFE
jgi:hypothetical protein